MTSSGIALLSSLSLSLLLRVNIATNFTQSFQKSHNINCTSSSKNENLFLKKATMNTSTMIEIVVGKNGELSNEKEEENWNRTELAEFAKEESTNTSKINENAVAKDGGMSKGESSYVGNVLCLNETCLIKCNNSADCGEDPRVTCRKAFCRCSRFHFHDPDSGECIPNITRILMWARKTASTESGKPAISMNTIDAVSQPSAFEVTQSEPYTVLKPIWAEYKGNKEAGLGFIPTPVWAIIVCICLLLLIYSLIIFDLL